MNYTQSTQGDSALVFVVAVVLLAFVIMFLYLSVGRRFINTRDFIKREISRSNAREQRYWKRELKKLYVSYIPIFGKYISKRIR